MRKSYMILVSIIFFLLAVPKIDAQTIIFEEGFEDGIPATWSQSGTGTIQWVKNTSNAKDGTASAYLSYSSTTPRKLITPAVNLLTGNTPVTLSFYNKQATLSGANDSLKIYYRTSASEAWIPLASYRDSASDFVLRTVELPNLSANYQIAFEGIINNKSGVYIDAVKIYDTPLCAQPINLSVSNVAQTSATLNWNVPTNLGNLTTAYQLKVSTTPVLNLNTGTGDVINSNITSTTNTYPINPLSAATKYYVYLRANCSADAKGYSNWSSYEFTTPCMAVSLPFIQNFEAIESGIPSCWRTAGTNTTLPEVSTTYKIGATSLKLTSGSSGDAYVVTPQLDGAANNLEINFKAYATSSNQRFRVFVMSDPYNISSASLIADLTLTTIGVWEDFALNTSKFGLSNANQYIVFYSPSGTANTVYLDDINIRLLPAYPRPDSLKVNGIDETFAQLSWLETGTATAWSIELIRPGIDTVDVAAATNPYVLTGLLPNTSYKARVRAALGTDYTTKSVTFKTVCVKTTIPFSESFEGTSATVALPDCWDNSDGTTTTASYRWSYNISGASGNGLAFTSTVFNAAGNTNFLKTPRFDLTTATTGTILKFKYRKPDAADFSIFISTDGGKTYTRSLATALPVASSYTDLELFHPYNANDTSVVFVFKGTSNATSSGYIYLDDVSVTAAPTCLKVKDITLSNITATTADIAWTPQGTATQWEFVRKSGGVTTKQILSAPAYPLTGLLPNTQYNDIVSVRGICAPGDTGEVLTKTFIYTTPCLPVSAFPYTQGFEGTNLGCWTSQHTAGSATTLWEPSTTYAHSGTKSAYLNLQETGNKVNLITPLLVIPSANTHQIDFWFRRYSSASYSGEGLKVWINTSPDTIGATPLTITGKSISFIEGSVTGSPVETGSEGWYEYSAVIPQSGDVYVIFEMIWKGGLGVAIDDVVVRKIPGCFSPKSFTVDSVSAESIKVNIADDLNTSWDIEYGAAGFTIGTGTRVTTSTDGAKITDLTPTSYYDVYVRANCEPTDSTSEWIGPVTILTAQIPAALPYTHGFEQEAENYKWTLLNGALANQWMVGNAVNNGGSKSLYISNDGFSCVYDLTSASSVFAFRTFTFDAEDEDNYKIQFDWRSGGEVSEWGSVNDYLRVFLVPSKLNIIEGATNGIGAATTNTPSGWIDLGNGALLNSNTWKTVKKTIHPAEAGNYNLVFYWRNDGANGTIPAAIDNISVLKVACNVSVPTGATAVTESSATVDWNSTADKWLIKVSTRSIDADSLNRVTANVRDNVETTAKPYLVEELNPNTAYYYYVRAVCGNDTSDWSDAGQFRTACLPTSLPYAEGFENTSDSRLECWTVASGTVSRSTTYKYNGSYSAKAEGATIVSPKLDVTALADYQISGFAYAATDNTTINIGIVVEPDDMGTYLPLSTVMIPNKNSWTEFTAYFTDLAFPGMESFSGAQHIVLSTLGDKTIYLDSVRVEENPDCLKPVELSVTNVSADSATFNWKGDTETQWQLRLLQGTTVVKDTVVNSHPVELGGLSALTTYSYAVRAICAVGDSSAWANGTAFTALCAPYYPTPFTENFNGATFPPDCWSRYDGLFTGAGVNTSDLTVVTGVPSGYSHGWFSTTTALNGSKHPKINLWSGSAFKRWLVSPQIRISDAEQRLYFNLALTAYNSTSSAAYINGNERFAVIISDDGGVTWKASNATIWDANGTNYKYENIPSGEGEEIAIDLSAYAGKTISVAFYAESASGASAGDNDLHIDDVQVRKLTTCFRPVAVNVYDITTETATVAINDTTNATEWEIAVGKTGFDPDTLSTYIPAPNDNVNLTGLSSSTSYEVYVRTVCGSEKSLWRKSSFTTLCLPFTITPATAFYEGFEGTSGSALPVCWVSNRTEGTATSVWSTSTVFANTGTRSAFLQYQASGSKIDLVTQALNLPEDDEYQLRFSMYRYSSASYPGEGIKIWINTTPDTIRATPLVIEQGVSFIRGSVTLAPVENGGVGWYEYTAPIPTNGNVYVIFETICKWGSAMALDDIYVEKVPSCKRPADIKLSDIQTTTAKVIITDTLASAWDIAVGLKGFAPDTLSTLIYSPKDTVSLPDLSASTIYDVYVRANCGSGSVGAWKKLTFITLCEPVVYITESTPYIENFDKYGTGTGTFPYCWAKYSTTTYTDPYLSIVSLTPPASLYMYFGNTVIFPEFDVDVNLLKISFSLQGSYPLQVGVVSDLSDPNSFVPVETVTGSGSFVRKEVLLRSYTGTGKHIAFKTSSTAYSIYIDSVVVSLAPTCYEPYDVKAFNVTDSSAYITWRKAPDSQSVEVKVKYTGGADTIVTSNDTVFLNNLSVNTLYSVQLRSTCIGNVLANWSDSIQFKTSRVPAPIPYIYGFEDATENDIWILENGVQGNRWIVSGKDPQAVKSSAQALYITNNDSINAYTTAGRASVVWAYRALKFEKGAYATSFVWKANGDASADYLRAFLAPASDLLQSGTLAIGGKTSVSATVTPADWIALDGGAKLNGDTNWKTQHAIANIPDAGYYNLVFLWRNDGTVGNQSPAAVDSIVIEKLNCAVPVNVVVSNVEADNANVKWSSLNEGAGYEVAYLPFNTPLANLDPADILLKDADSIHLTGLSPSTAYKVYVRARCAESLYSAWTDSIPFTTTQIPANLPYAHGFENPVENANWLLINGTQTNQWVIGSTVSNGGSNALYISNDGGITNDYSGTMSFVYASRVFSLNSGTPYSISFDWRAMGEEIAWDIVRAFLIPSSVQLTAGDAFGMIGSINTVPSGWIAVSDALYNNPDWTSYNAKVTVPTSEYYQLAFFWRNDGSLTDPPAGAIDNISVKQITCADITGLVADSIGSDAVRMKWNKSGAASYQVKLFSVPVMASQITATAALQNKIVTDSLVRFAGLTPATDYYAYVRGICGVNDSGEWSPVISFKTLCIPLAVPYAEDFEGTMFPGDCWSRHSGAFVNNILTSALTPTTSGWQTVTTNYGLQSKHSKVNVRSTNKYWLVTPALMIPDAEQVLSFDLALTAYNSASAIASGKTRTDDKFKVIVSEDAGLTWYDANATVWDNVGSAKVYANISPAGEVVTIPLAAYSGKTIKVAFYIESTSAGDADDDIHIDNVRIGCYGGSRTVNDVTCANGIYQGHGFTIPATLVTPGNHTFTRLKAAASAAECDTTILLNLNVGSPVYTALKDTICQGQTYNKNGFVGQTEAGSYVLTDLATVAGCDSIVTLELTVVKVTSVTNATICEGIPYLFGDMEYTLPGTYIDSTKNMRGCDSIATLNLTVIPHTVNVTINLCEGGTYVLGDTTLATTGVFVRTLTNRLGCDSVVTVNLTVYPEYIYLTPTICQGGNYRFEVGGVLDTVLTTPGIYQRPYINPAGCRSVYQITLSVLEPDIVDVSDYACEGYPYYEHGYINGLEVKRDTVIYESSESIFGCDSVARVFIKFEPTKKDTTQATVAAGQVFIWENNSYSQSGLYGPVKKQTILGCDSLVWLDLTVTSGLNDLYSRSFTVSPNPVKRNESILVNFQFTEAERRGLKMEVINSLGQVIRNYNPSGHPIRIQGLNTAGFYLIRITTGEGTFYHGEVIVK